ncbi:MAG: succinate dehydrogenase assembly factor 2 [Polynucleobacter sp.]|nr:succinate dehydrogenase assembly factor 2 [Polynucleobacter sp.]MDZ4055778.1 succinate dehydrogenase assembly factor 2 [Polynucleobacter sp.]
MTIGAAELYRLKSDARRGLLENDLILERFFRRYADALSKEDGVVLAQLLALSDNDLMDLLIGRVDALQSLGDLCDTPGFKRTLMRLREKS